MHPFEVYPYRCVQAIFPKVVAKMKLALLVRAADVNGHQFEVYPY